MNDSIITNSNLHDNYSTNFIKVYPYSTRIADAKLTFMSGAFSLVGISPIGIDDKRYELILDENGVPCFEIFGAIDGTNGLNTALGSDTSGQRWGKVVELDGQTNGIISEMIEFERIDLFTINDPFDEDKYWAGTQRVYFGEWNVADTDLKQVVFSTLSTEEKAHISDDTIISSINLVDITTKVQGITDAKIYITSNVNYVSIEDVNKLELTIPKTSFFDDVSITNTDNVVLDVNTNDDQEIVYHKLIPTNSTNRITLYNTWFDYNLTLPLFRVNMFEKATPLSKLFKKDNSNTSGWIDKGEDLHKLLMDMLSYSVLFNSQWSEIEDGDRLDHTDEPTYGAIKNNIYVGQTYQKPINTIANKNPAEVINGLYETFLIKNPAVAKSSLAIFKASVVALSRYIIGGNLAIGGGLSDYGESYLPWTLELGSALDAKRHAIMPPNANADSTPTKLIYYIDDGVTAKVSSHYFDVSTTISPQKNLPLNNVKIIKAENNTSIPKLPETLKLLKITSNPGDINLKSDIDLMYMLKSTLDKSEFENVYVKDPKDVPIAKDKKTVELDGLKYIMSNDLLPQKAKLLTMNVWDLGDRAYQQSIYNPHIPNWFEVTKGIKHRPLLDWLVKRILNKILSTINLPIIYLGGKNNTSYAISIVDSNSNTILSSNTLNLIRHYYNGLELTDTSKTIINDEIHALIAQSLDTTLSQYREIEHIETDSYFKDTKDINRYSNYWSGGTNHKHYYGNQWNNFVVRSSNLHNDNYITVANTYWTKDVFTKLMNNMYRGVDTSFLYDAFKLHNFGGDLYYQHTNNMAKQILTLTPAQIAQLLGMEPDYISSKSNVTFWLNAYSKAQTEVEQKKIYLYFELRGKLVFNKVELYPRNLYVQFNGKYTDSFIIENQPLTFTKESYADYLHSHSLNANLNTPMELVTKPNEKYKQLRLTGMWADNYTIKVNDIVEFTFKPNNVDDPTNTLFSVIFIP